ncbi:MAG: hypothetical protein KM310_08615 [Clostridiales bacterium]|nr:hypothetical protein [Clostridiales bacterium]
MGELLPPYGGTLVSLYDEGWEEPPVTMPVGENLIQIIGALASGALSPLRGFMDREASRSVVEEMRLPGGLPFPYPIWLPVPPLFARRLKEGDRVGLQDTHGNAVALLEVHDVFTFDPRWKPCLGPEDVFPPRYPHVFLGGTLKVVRRLWAGDEPYSVRELFFRRGMTSLAGKALRDPLFRDTEYLLRLVLEEEDGVLLLLYDDDAFGLPARLRAEGIRRVLQSYLPPRRVEVVVRPWWPVGGHVRKALLGAVVLRNYGCRRILYHPDDVGEDGVPGGRGGRNYRLLESWLSHFAHHLEVTPFLSFQVYFCDGCGQLTTSRTCPHGPLEKVMMNRERLGRLLQAGVTPPPQYVRPELARYLLGWTRGGRGKGG